MVVCWPVVTSYFLTLGEDNCPRLLWTYFAAHKHGVEVEPDEQAENTTELYIYYLKFLENVMQILHDAVLLVEGDEVTACELYDIMSTVRTKLQQRIDDSSFGFEAGQALVNLDGPHETTVKQDLIFEECVNVLGANV